MGNRGRGLVAVDDDLWTCFLRADADNCFRCINGLIDRAYAGAGERARLRAVLTVGEQRRSDVERGRGVGWWASKDEFLDGCDLFAIVIFLEGDQLGLHVFDEGVAFGPFELGEEFFCFSLDGIAGQEGGGTHGSHNCHIGLSS